LAYLLVAVVSVCVFGFAAWLMGAAQTPPAAYAAAILGVATVVAICVSLILYGWLRLRANRNC
jgi:hypothetical protein